MIGKPAKVVPADAIKIARAFIESERIVAGDFVDILHISEQQFIDNVGGSPGHGVYMVDFAYAGPPVHRDPNVCDCPPADSPVTIELNGQTGEALLFLKL